MGRIVGQGVVDPRGGTSLRRFQSPVFAVPHPRVVRNGAVIVSSEHHNLAMRGIVRHGVPSPRGGDSRRRFLSPVFAVPKPGVVEGLGGDVNPAGTAGPPEQDYLALRGIVGHGVSLSRWREILRNLPRPVRRGLRRHHEGAHPQQSRDRIPGNHHVPPSLLRGRRVQRQRHRRSTQRNSKFKSACVGIDSHEDGVTANQVAILSTSSRVISSPVRS